MGDNKSILPAIILVLIFVTLMENQTPGTSGVTHVTYVYEKDDNTVPPEVAICLRELNGRGVLATSMDDDTKTGDGVSPNPIALKAAQEAGLPALVVQAGDRVINVKANPKTKQDVIDAVGELPDP